MNKVFCCPGTRLSVIVFIFSILSHSVYAYNYGEHKIIGDRGFLRFVQSLQASNAASVLQYLDLVNADGSYYFEGLSHNNGNKISYGVLNALSGDHESNPLLLEEQLMYKGSVMERIIQLHEQYIAMGHTAAPDGKLSRIDFSYALKAALNLAHFYEYRKGFQAQLRHFNKDIIRQCENPSLVTDAFRQLGKTNAVNMYVTLHVLAMDLAAKSGGLIHSDTAAAKQFMFYALLFNGFADHFLEDAFSAGHLVVNRAIFQSVTNNKALHDFYCANGTEVLNRKGEIWYAYGDGQFNNPQHHWRNDTALQEIRYNEFTAEANRIIEAVYLSLDDLAQAFQKAADSKSYTPFLEIIPDDKDNQALFLLDHIPSLKLVPIPYNSDLDILFANYSAVTTEMKKVNNPLRYRDFVRSRVGNSLVVGLVSGFFSDHYIKGPEIRINAGNFSKRFDYNDDGGKKGLLDHWLGYTMSYSFANLKDKKTNQITTATAQQLRIGIKGNFDYWVSDRKFIGFYSYTEAGAQFTSGGTAFVFVPSLGFQWSSLFNINPQTMKSWWRIPIQYLLPLKLRYGVVISPHAGPRYFSAADIDILL